MSHPSVSRWIIRYLANIESLLEGNLSTNVHHSGDAFNHTHGNVWYIKIPCCVRSTAMPMRQWRELPGKSQNFQCSHNHEKISTCNYNALNHGPHNVLMTSKSWLVPSQSHTRMMFTVSFSVSHKSLSTFMWLSTSLFLAKTVQKSDTTILETVGYPVQCVHAHHLASSLGSVIVVSYLFECL